MALRSGDHAAGGDTERGGTRAPNARGGYRAGGDTASLGYTSINADDLDAALLRADHLLATMPIADFDKRGGIDTSTAIEAALSVRSRMSYAERLQDEAAWARFQTLYEERQDNLANHRERVIKEWGLSPAGFSESEQYGQGVLYSESPQEDTRHTAKIEIWRSMVKVRVKYIQPYRSNVSTASKRGKVCEFSSRSRNRMQETIAQIDDKRRCFFVTLTYHHKFPLTSGGDIDPQTIKYHMKLFRQRLLHNYKTAAGIWRLEIVRRKSGLMQGCLAPHYHLLIWLDCSTAANLQEDFTNWWLAIIGEENNRHARLHAVDFKPVENMNHASWYVSKYAAKMGDDGDGVLWGRRWATFGAVVWGSCYSFPLRISEHMQLKQICGLWLATRGETASFYGEMMQREWNLSGYRVLGLGFDTIEFGRRTIYKYLCIAGELDDRGNS